MTRRVLKVYNALDLNYTPADDNDAARKVDVDAKADKPSESTAGNLAALDAGGNLTDAGTSAGAINTTIETHVNATTAHGSTATPTAERIAEYNSAGNLQSGAPTEENEVTTRGFIAEIFRTIKINVKAAVGMTVTLSNCETTITRQADADGFVNIETEKQGDWTITATYYGVIVGQKTVTAYLYNSYDVDLEIPEGFVLYGVRHYVAETSPALTRLADSADFTFTPENSEQFGSSSFDDLPIYSGIKTCVVTVNDGDLSVVYEDDPGFSRTPDAGDVCVEIPKFYYFRDGSHLNDETPYEDLYISNFKLNNNFRTSPSHMDRGDGVGERDKVYIGAYETNASYRSVSGSAVLRNTTISTARAGYNNRSTKIQEYDILDLMTVYILYMVEVANLNSQEAVGKGNAGGTGVIETGTTDTLFYCSGNSEGVKYRGIENLWSNVLSYVAGVKVDINRTVYVCYISANETIDNSFDNYINTGIMISSTNGVINRMSFSESFPFLYITTGSGGSNTSQYYCDQMIATLPTGAAALKTAGYYSNLLLGGLFFSAYSRGITSRDGGDGFRLHII